MLTRLDYKNNFNRALRIVKNTDPNPIRFMIMRYVNACDLSQTDIRVCFVTESGAPYCCNAENVEVSTHYIEFDFHPCLDWIGKQFINIVCFGKNSRGESDVVWTSGCRFIKVVADK